MITKEKKNLTENETFVISTIIKSFFFSVTQISKEKTDERN